MKPFLLFLILIWMQLPASPQTTKQDPDTVILQHLLQQLDLSVRDNKKDSEALYLGWIGYHYQSKHHLLKACEFYEKGLAVAQCIADTTMIGLYLLDLGIIYKQQGNYHKALDHMLRASVFIRNMDDRYPDIEYKNDLASCYNSIGDIYRIQEQYILAKKYYLAGLALRRGTKNNRGIAGSLNCLGMYFTGLKQYDSALFYFYRSLELKEKIGDAGFIPSTYLNIGYVYLAKKDEYNAEKKFLQATALDRAARDKITLAEAYSALASLYYEQKKYTPALRCISKGGTYAEAHNLRTIMLTNYDLKRRIYRRQSRFQLALEYDDRYISLKDSLLTSEKNKNIAEMSARYESERKDQQLDKLMLKQREQQLRMIIMLVLIFFLSFIVIIVIVGLRRGQKNILRARNDKNRIGMLMKELNHRVKNNLQLLQSLLYMQQERLEDAKAKDAVREIENRVKAMIHIHRKFYREDELTKINLKEYLSGIADDLIHSYGLGPELTYTVMLEDVFIDPDKAILLGLITNEIISNSFKHAFKDHDHPQLSIVLRSVSNTHIELQIGDNSREILTSEHLEKADSFGLKLIRLLAKQLKAKMTITNRSGIYYSLIVEKSSG